MSEMELVGVRVEKPTNTPIALLREREGDGRLLPIFIGGPEATAIAFAIEEVVTPRPMTPTTSSRRCSRTSAPAWSASTSQTCATAPSSPKLVPARRRRRPPRVEPPVRRHRAGPADPAHRSSPPTRCSMRPVTSEAVPDDEEERRRGRRAVQGVHRLGEPRGLRLLTARPARGRPAAPVDDGRGRALGCYTAVVSPVSRRPPQERGQTLDEGYSGKRAAEVVGITYRQLDYWARTDLVRPSLADAKGSGSRRRYSYRDLLELKVIKTPARRRHPPRVRAHGLRVPPRQPGRGRGQRPARHLRRQRGPGARRCRADRRGQQGPRRCSTCCRSAASRPELDAAIVDLDASQPPPPPPRPPPPPTPRAAAQL